MDKKHIKNTITIQILLYFLIVIESSHLFPTEWVEIQTLHYAAYTIFNIIWNSLMSVKL